MPEQGNGFYKEKFFDEMSARFDRLEVKMDEQSKDIADLKAKLSYIFGWAAAAGAVAGILFDWLKSKIIQ